VGRDSAIRKVGVKQVKPSLYLSSQLKLWGCMTYFDGFPEDVRVVSMDIGKGF
jgi:hypothetical protein